MPHHPVDTFVGKKIRLRRKMLGLSQEAVASALGITFQQVRKYETGDNRVSASRLVELASALSVPVTYFFEGLSNDDSYAPASGKKMALAEPAAAYDSDIFTKSETIDLVKNYYRLSPSVRKKVVEMVKAMAGDKSTLE